LGTIIDIKNISKSFGGIIACNDISFYVKEGEIKGLIGPNGAGKTTIFNLITGAYGLDEGNIFFCGKEIGRLRPDQIVKRGITRTFQNIRLFQNLTVLENVIIALDQWNANYNFFSAMTRLPTMLLEESRIRKLAQFYLHSVGLEGRETQVANSLPYGLQRKLEIARALALQPKLLLLDEPAAGMNEEESMELAQLIKRVKERFNLTIILIEHHMDVVMEICDSILVINFGEVLSEGTAFQIQNDPDVLKAYLGARYNA
jgi:branched-chain amino acid transport system ATP-binding protein